MSDTYWRCICGSVSRWGRGDPNEVPGYVCRECAMTGPWTEVAVVPVAELEALRALRARVEDDELVPGIVKDHSAIDAYRRALRGEG